VAGHSGLPFIVPEEEQLTAFFGADPTERAVDDGYWCYESVDDRGVKLRFSFDALERSVQTQLLLSNLPVATVSHEGAIHLRLDDRVLRCDFRTAGSKASLTITIGSVIQCDWSTLQTEV
jgi:hypothetical protein